MAHSVLTVQGHPPGRPLTDLELRHIKFLLDVYTRATEGMHTFKIALEDFVLECRDSGCSARGMADQLGVGSSTIQTWTKNAERRRQQG